MNRRQFIAGLLASTALPKAVPAPKYWRLLYQGNPIVWTFDPISEVWTFGGTLSNPSLWRISWGPHDPSIFPNTPNGD
jgi:hypothetical protein